MAMTCCQNFGPTWFHGMDGTPSPPHQPLGAPATCHLMRPQIKLILTNGPMDDSCQSQRQPETARDSQRHLTCCLCVAWDLNPGRMLILLSCDADFSKALAFWNPKNPKTCQTHPLQCHYSNCLILHYRHSRVH